jgi:hypothetical protein
MSDHNRDAQPDPSLDDMEDTRSDLEQAVEARADAVERGEGGGESPLEPTVSVDSAGGAGGEVKNQGADGQ